MQEKIVGTVMPVLELTLDPGESIFAESGELSWMTESIAMATTTQTGGGGGAMGALKRMAGGSSLFMTAYMAQGAPGMVAFAAKLPGQIFPIDVTPQPGAGYRAHRHAFVAGTHGVQLSIGFQQRLGAGIFGGDGFRLQAISGQGRAWIELSGEIVVYDLVPGQTMRVHPGHVGLFQESVNFGITTVPGIRNKLFGGDGVFLATLTGPGRVWLQSLPLARLAHALGEYGAVQGAEAGAAGGVAASVMRGIFKG
ncbi:MAG: TIGR00266 family protein [Chloroflexi bacterium]|nr:MAG: TIGR00266 family protein [Chloroflexota bacterium]